MRGGAFMLGSWSVVAIVATLAVVGFTLGFAWWERKNGRNQ